jgi:hypothetical protein
MTSQLPPNPSSGPADFGRSTVVVDTRRKVEDQLRTAGNSVP